MAYSSIRPTGHPTRQRKPVILRGFLVCRGSAIRDRRPGFVRVCPAWSVHLVLASGLEKRPSVRQYCHVKEITKRELVRNPSVVANLKPGESVAIKGRGGEDLVLSHRKRRKLSAEEIEAELQRMAADDPPLDVQAVLNDLRG